jgi:osmoprotectant transport system ATP-binding protein
MIGNEPHRPSRSPALRLRNVSKSYDEGLSHAVRDVSLEVGNGEFVALVGGSGSGKTTTLKMLNRLIEPDSGVVEIGGKDVRSLWPHELRRSIGYVFQGVGLFPRFTVEENVAITPRLLGWSDERIRERVGELLDLVELPHEIYGTRFPDALSGGQCQRVGFARALAAKPQIVLMDEPFGALDALTRQGLAQAYLRLHERFSLTTVMVTHDVHEALLLANRLGVMREGRLIALGPPQDLLRENKNGYVRDLLSTPRQQAARIAERLGDG